MLGEDWRIVAWAYAVLAVVGWFGGPWIARWCNVPMRRPWYHWRRVVVGAVLFPLLVAACLALAVAGVLFVVTSTAVGIVRGLTQARRGQRAASDAGSVREVRE